MATPKTRGTGWRRLIGSPKLQIIFHKRATKYRSLLRKMTYKDKGSYEPSLLWNTLVFMKLLYVSFETCSFTRSSVSFTDLVACTGLFAFTGLFVYTGLSAFTGLFTYPGLFAHPWVSFATCVVPATERNNAAP